MLPRVGRLVPTLSPRLNPRKLAPPSCKGVQITTAIPPSTSSMCASEEHGRMLPPQRLLCRSALCRRRQCSGALFKPHPLMPAPLSISTAAGLPWRRAGSFQTSSTGRRCRRRCSNDELMTSRVAPACLPAICRAQPTTQSSSPAVDESERHDTWAAAHALVICRACARCHDDQPCPPPTSCPAGGACGLLQRPAFQGAVPGSPRMDLGLLERIEALPEGRSSGRSAALRGTCRAAASAGSLPMAHLKRRKRCCAFSIQLHK